MKVFNYDIRNFQFKEAKGLGVLDDKMKKFEIIKYFNGYIYLSFEDKLVVLDRESL